MKINKLTENECRAVLARASMGRLGCSLQDQPYVLPVYLAYESDYIYFFSTVGKKIQWMRANPKACVEVDEIMNQSHWLSVIVTGRYQELPEPLFAAEAAHARKLLEKQHHWWLNALAERRTKTQDQSIAPVFFRIQVDSMTGLGAQADGDEPGAVNK